LRKRLTVPEFTEKYVNSFTDYGFKRLFGEEPNKVPAMPSSWN